VKVEGQVLLAGSYGLDMIPKEDGSVTIIINKNSESFGSFFYDISQDALRVEVQSIETGHHELLTYEFTETSANGAALALIWEKKAIPMKIDLDTPAIVMQKIKNELTGRA